MIKRPLTLDPVPRKRGCQENADGDLIIHADDVISPQKGVAYRFLELLGKGVFGCVYEAVEVYTGQQCAIKVSSDARQSIDSSYREINIFRWINREKGCPSQYSARYIDSFEIGKHQFIVIEKLNSSVLQIIEANRYYGLPLPQIQKVLQHLSVFLRFMHNNKVIHADLKPENIMLGFDNCYKVIDFGGALISDEYERAISYIQSRFYRAPEVILNLALTPKIDIWSLGCIICELAVGLPILAGDNELAMLQLMQIRVGDIPKWMKNSSSVYSNFFDASGNLVQTQPVKDLCNFPLHPISSIIISYPHYADNAKADVEIEERKLLIDLLKGMLCIDPKKRFTIDDVCNHPFLHATFYNSDLF